MNSNKFVICIPTHKAKLSDYEKQNIDITIKNNSKTKTFFLMPENLNDRYYKKYFPFVKIKTFKKKYFENEMSYNKFMLSNIVYNEFKKFKFLILCQTDAIILRDISKIKNLNYDYVGSPWQPAKKINILDIYGFGFVNKLIKLKFRRLHVGNGGLSIRKVKKFIEVTKKIKSSVFINCGEDIFISFFSKEFGLKIPNTLEAKKIFQETTITTHNLELVKCYGFHALEKWNPILLKKVYEKNTQKNK